MLIPYVRFNRRDHQAMHEKHKGHESMHLEMMIILLVTLIVAQVLLVQWKKRAYRSYSVITDIIFLIRNQLMFYVTSMDIVNNTYWLVVDTSGNVCVQWLVEICHYLGIIFNKQRCPDA